MSATPNIDPLKIKGNKLDAIQAPGVSDDSSQNYSVGSKWVDVTNDKVYFCTDATVGAATWSEVGSGGGGNTIYNADDTIGTNRIVDLTDSLRFQDSTGNNVVKINGSGEFELSSGGSIYGKMFTNGKWALGGSTTIGSQSGITLHKNTLIKSESDSASNIAFQVLDTSNSSIFRVYGDKRLLFGANNFIGSEGMSIQKPTAIKGIGTTGSSLLSLYNGASTPVKVAEFSDNGKFEMSTTTSGILLPRLTTAEKIAISTPDTNLVVFDTTLNSLQRWNGTAWVSMASGYGIVQVLRDSDNGNPTFYSDLQSGLETCKTAGSRNTVVLCSDVTTTTSININRGGSGLGNGYEYETLTIDFNGFTLTNNQADSSFAFDVSFGNIVAENRQITFKNGRVLRTSGTGTHYALHCDEGENDGHLFMSNMYWLCENSHTIKLEIDEFDSSYKDFGGSIFESNGGTCLRIQHYSCKNFTCISNSALNCFTLIENSKATNFEVLNTSTGNGINVGGTNDITFFKVKTISGIGIDCGDDFEGVCSQFYIETTTGEGIDTTGTNSGFDLKFSHFVIKSENATCIDSNHNNTIFSNFAVSNDSDTKPTISEVNNGDRKYINGTVINYGTNFCFIAINVKDIELNNVTLISRGGTTCNVSVDNALYNVTFNHCSFIAQSNVSTAHAVFIGTTIGSVGFLNCSFDVANASANCLNATTSRTIAVGNSGFKGATTPINSNITVSLTTAPDSNGNYTL